MNYEFNFSLITCHFLPSDEPAHLIFHFFNISIFIFSPSAEEKNLLRRAVETPCLLAPSSWPLISELVIQIDAASVVQGERRGKLAWPLLSRRPHSPLHLNCSGKGTTIPTRCKEISTKPCVKIRKQMTSSKSNFTESVSNASSVFCVFFETHI